MNKIFQIIVLSFLASGLFAQQRAKLYLNKREIAIRSVHFLDAATIDSINFYTGAEANEKLHLQTIGVDSIFVIFKKDLSDVVSYYQLLDLYHLDARARALPLNLSSLKDESPANAQMMMFSLNKVPGVLIEIKYNTHADYVSLSRGYQTPYRSDAGKMLTWLQGYVEGVGDNFYYRKFKKQ
jgi:hypothetical protein